MITELKENQVFVCGINFSGFHGGGAAASAFRYDTSKNWRYDPFFLSALAELNKRKQGRSYDESKLIGKWAVLGKTGFSVGKEGRSYGVITTEKPGFQGCVDSDFLIKEIQKFLKFTNLHPEYEFLCVNFGLNRANGGFSWWTPRELRKIWYKASEGNAIPMNIRPPAYLFADYKG